MKNYEWERTSATWKALKPLRGLHSLCDNDESTQQHYLRLRSRFNIPLEVIEQWLYPHYCNIDSVNNYGWLNYDDVIFDNTYMLIRQLMDVHILTAYEPYVRARAVSTPFDGFMCIDQDKKYWQEKGTWRVPPIILDVLTIHDVIPSYAEIKGPFQLVEGHSRLGYLLALHNAGILKSESQHLIYRMYVREN